ncbi:PD-(D/E)XK nuclease family protein (plasmid) [Acaryochloris sp. 'Moss Beach']|uniref:RecB family exonuclease n=1 Tax=Acaryochloris sp. 'Moss Beach' TaxID=2740837 RepID=UPI001F43A136|nr:PD-(D/E)XK nuclease family protein [Acaryochloris sp. 'Moss Beach']UJB73140.1 PD-(D/E)XK nuclease family protein [Acaryochloris sp. 'Moss Beach']
MAYPLSATKLITYKQCPQAYSFKYERGLSSPSAFGSPKFGNALHGALADIYKDWNYAYPLPSLDWFAVCWQQHTGELTPAQIHEGWMALQLYYEKYVAPLPMIRKPLGVEAKLKASFQVNNIEFSLSGRYDRLDFTDDGLELIDYKTSKTIAPSNGIDLQLGLYYLILEQTYQKALQKLSLIYLRQGQKITFDVTPEHHQQVRELIGDMALKLRADQDWEPDVGGHCDRCGYQKYCPARSEKPEPLPEGTKRGRQVQLVLGL